MNNKTKHETSLQKGVDIYIDHQKEFEDEFESFFEDIRAFCKEKLKASIRIYEMDLENT